MVLSSNWRIGNTPEIIREAFKSSGLSFGHYFEDKTVDILKVEENDAFCPHATNHQCRAAEIKKYLKEHNEITNWLVFDDVDSHLEKAFGPRFIKINRTKLVSAMTFKTTVARIVEIHKAKRNQDMAQNTHK